MHNNPSLLELVEAVKAFIDSTAAPNLSGHAAFHARVASNVLATIHREIDQGSSAEKAEHQRLHRLLETSEDTSVHELNRLLCERIRTGEMTYSTPGLMEHLKSTVISQLDIDQPRYSGRKRLS